MENCSLLRKNKRLFGLYSLLFVFLAAIVFSYFYLNGKTFIHGDGWYQHYTSLLYYSQYLKEAFHDLFVNHSLSFPTWDFSIGEGEDIIAAMHYYCIGDPIAFFSFLVPENKLYLYYGFSSVLRIYLAGLSFIYLCLYTKNKNHTAVLAGALAYTFCYWNLLNTSKHIFFLNPMIYFPMIITGVEKVINKDNGFFLSFAVCLGGLSNFYFFYMMVMLTVLYVAVRLLTKHGKDLMGIVKDVISVFAYSLIGVMLAAVILFPVINIMLSSGRLSVEYGFHFLYPRFYYERLVTMFLTCDNDHWLVMGFVSPVVLSTILAIKQVKKDPLLFILHLIALFGVTMPIFGKVLNGFAYVANRWSFSLALLTSFTLVKKWDEFKENKKFLLIVVPAFALFSFITAWWRLEKLIPTLIYLAFLLVSVFDLKVYARKPYLRKCLMVGLIVLSILNTADYAFSERGKNRINGAKSVDEARHLIDSTEASVFKEYIEGKDDGFFRYSGSQLTTNVAMLEDVYSTNYYFSLSNANVGEYRSKLGLNEYFLNWYNEYDKRSPLYSLANVRYYLTPEGEQSVPHGFSYLESYKGQDIYQNSLDLPFGYTYNKTISYEAWDKLSQSEKEEMLLQRIVLENGEADGSLIPLGNDHQCLMNAGENTEINGNVITVKENKGDVILSFDGEEDKVYYFCVEGISYDDHEDYFSGDPITDVSLNLEFNDDSREIIYHTEDYQFYNARDSYISCLGYREKGIDEIRLSFSRKGDYVLDKVFVRCIDATQYEQYIDKLKEEHLENVAFFDDKVRGEIDLNEDKYLLLSIPYSKGWKAFVDGNEVETMRANGCYTGLKLQKGHHEIKLEYHTPLLTVGMIVSVVSFVAVLVFLLLSKKKSERMSS